MVQQHSAALCKQWRIFHFSCAAQLHALCGRGLRCCLSFVQQAARGVSPGLDAAARVSLPAAV